MKKIKLKVLECKRCGYKWHPRVETVRVCPHCKNPYWNVERKRGKGVKTAMNEVGLDRDGKEEKTSEKGGAEC